MRSGRITFVELLVIMIVAGILGALLVPTSGPKPPLTDKDLALYDWQPGPQHTAVPPDSIRVREADLIGLWTDEIGWLDFDITKLPDGHYSVSFRSHAQCACSGAVQLERFAEYENGVILLDRPVRELGGTTYEKLFTVRVNDEIYLLPSPRVIDFGVGTSVPHRGVLVRAARQ